MSIRREVGGHLSLYKLAAIDTVRNWAAELVGVDSIPGGVGCGQEWMPGHRRRKDVSASMRWFDMRALGRRVMRK